VQNTVPQTIVAAADAAPWWGIPVIAGCFLLVGATLAFLSTALSDRRKMKRDDLRQWDKDLRDLYVQASGVVNEIVRNRVHGGYFRLTAGNELPGIYGEYVFRSLSARELNSERVKLAVARRFPKYERFISDELREFHRLEAMRGEILQIREQMIKQIRPLEEVYDSVQIFAGRRTIEGARELLQSVETLISVMHDGFYPNKAQWRHVHGAQREFLNAVKENLRVEPYDPYVFQVTRWRRICNLTMRPFRRTQTKWRIWRARRNAKGQPPRRGGVSLTRKE
jgi:hypothetical protein